MRQSEISSPYALSRRDLLQLAVPLALMRNAQNGDAFGQAASDPKHKVAIFAGHIEMPHPATKEGPGSQSASGTLEYRFNDELSQKLASLQNPSAEYQVRYATENILLAERPKTAQMMGSEIYVEIHHDSAQVQDLARLRKGEQTEAGWKEVSGFSVIYSPTSPHSHESLRLSQLIADELFNSGFRPNIYHAKNIVGERRPLVDASRAIYTGGEYAVRQNVMPAAIVEAGVIANPFEEKILRQPETQIKIAKSIDAAVAKYFAEKKPK